MNHPIRRGLTHSVAILYLGVSLREFRSNWLPHLAVVIAGNRRLVDKHELDALFEQRKQVCQRDKQQPSRLDEPSARELSKVLKACRQFSQKKRGRDA